MQGFFIINVRVGDAVLSTTAVVPVAPVTSMTYSVGETKLRSLSLKNVIVRLSESIVMAGKASAGDTVKV